MNELQKALQEYLAIRRSLGFKLARAEKLLNQFLAYMDRVDAVIVTIDVAVAWAMQPPDGTSGWRAHRLSVVRGFARHLHAIDPRHQVPPTDLLVGGRRRRATPYPYSPEDIAGLMAAARSLRRFPLRALTFETLIGLLSATGLRVGEAIRLNRVDIDWRVGQLTVAETKFNKTRLVPLHSTTAEALRAYDRRRDELCPRPVDPSFFVSTAGTRLRYDGVHWTWLKLVRLAGLEALSESCRPRPHDLRHRFAVTTLVGWFHDGGDVQSRLPLLSTVLGHVHPGSTYWYLSAAPELLGLAAQRLEVASGTQT